MPADEITPVADTVIVRPDPVAASRADRELRRRPLAAAGAGLDSAPMASRSALVGRAGRARAARRGARSGRGSGSGSLVLARGRGGRRARRASPTSWPRARTRWCSAGRASQGGDGALRAGRRGAALATCARARTASTSCGPLRAHLALILPELGDPAPASDRATLFEAVRGALAHLAARAARAARARRPAVVRRRHPRAARRRSPSRSASCRCSWSPATAPTACRATTRCAGCATSCAAAGASRS